MTRKYFGTDGIRGRANAEPFTPETLTRIAQAIGLQFLKDNGHHRVVIGKDTRVSGYMIESALTAGFTSIGIEVLSVGVLPTPAIAMLTRTLRADLGVMISASHNPYYDNGIKLFTAEGIKLSDDVEMEIEERISTHMPLAAPSKLGYVQRIPDAGGRYIEFVKNSIARNIRLEGFHIVLDCAQGAAYKVAPTVLHELGAHVIRMGCEPDGININEGCGATHTAKLSQKVMETGADLGIAFDGDADRVAFCDEHGHEINGDQIMALIGKRWHQEGRLKSNSVVATVMSNLGLEKYLEGEGLKLVRTPVGDRYVAEKMRKEGYNVGGEQSGHIILSDYSSAGDGLLTALQILSVFATEQKPASQLFRVFEPYPQVLKNVKLDTAIITRPEAESLIQNLQKKLGNDGRVLVRPSGTEPLVRIMIEGPDQVTITEDAEILASAFLKMAS
ncbi:Phosphoglucosamine mutase [Candidatus Bealeia paramacronuclearis]|uniref:Phosphoglucosamine mutase n=1 Tax=Candidatus Bealeia paramacronuclearis TaxID=1921001 RepID=A0ABZ2C0F7_9PROT|nr:Phosphoglucosamine mutase [Candidatus Bealeia paramacronuclearis]